MDLANQLRARLEAAGRALYLGLGGPSSRERVRFSVGQADFHNLPDRVSVVAAELGLDLGSLDLQPYRPEPLHRAEALLVDWLADLREQTAHLPIEIEAPSPQLLSLLRQVGRRADPFNQGELLRLLGALTGGVFRGPHTFHLDVANACNVNCKYCWFHSPLSKNRKDAADFDAEWRKQMVDWDVFLGIVDDLAALGTHEDVLLSGKGEPLLHPRCLDMVAAIKERGMGVTLFSNGLLLRDAVREGLVTHGADLVYVSLSSASHATYEAIHPGHEGEELDEVRANVGALTELKQQRGSQVPRVMMVDVLCGSNAHEALDFYKMSRDLGAEHVRFQLIHVQDYNRELMLRPEQIGPLREALEQAEELAALGGPTIVDNIHYQLSTIDPATGKWGHSRTPDEGCYVGWTFSRSWTNGDISFCCSPKVIDNVQNRSFREVWKGPEYGAFRQAARDLQENGEMTFRNGAPLLGEHCSGCPNYEGIGKLAGDLKRYGLSEFVQGRDGERLRGSLSQEEG